MNIISYNATHKQVFYDLNIEWLETFFYVEPYDEEVLSHPETHIINAGGHIFFAIENNKAIATVALLKRDEGTFELTKMALQKDQRGKGIGKKLLEHCIDFAKEASFNGLFLYSNTRLENAIHLYRAYGFEEVALEQPNPYKRADIKMVYPLYKK